MKNFKFLRENRNYNPLIFTSPGISVVEVSENVRPMKVNWTHELSQDVSVFHNIDAEAQLTAILSESIKNEINNLIGEQLTNNLFPIISRVVSRTIASDIVAVQPMSLPIGNLFFINDTTIKKKIFKFLRGYETF